MNTPRFTLLTALLLLLVCGSTYAQSFEDLNDRDGDNAFTDRGFHLFARYTHVNSKYAVPYGGFTFNGSFRIDRTGKGEVSYRLENPTLGDMIYILFNIDEIGKNDGTDMAYGSGFFGWHQVYWNVVAKDRLLISPGISLGDYIFGTTRKDGQTLEPQGYYFHLGPAFKTSYVINNSFWVDGYLHYDIGFKAGKGFGQHIKGYPKPHFLNVGATINNVQTRLFAGVRVNKMIDRGSNEDSASRLDISAGIYF